MQSSLKILASILFASTNALHFNITEQIDSLYNGVLNGYNHPNKLDNWMNKFSNNIKYCDNTIRKDHICMKKPSLQKTTQNNFFKQNNLITAKCNIIKQYDPFFVDYKCQFTIETKTPNGNTKCTTTISRTEHIGYNHGKIVQYKILKSAIISTDCKSNKISPKIRRLNADTNICYNTQNKNPCTSENIAAKNFYFSSCSSCCNFIQCDEAGQAFDRPCAPGTFWDQELLTCNHNNGKCTDCAINPNTPQPTFPPCTTKNTITPTDDKCFDTKYNNPCTEKNTKDDKFYFPSCSSCCNYIQCDAFGKAYDRPCAPGAFWDQNALTCNHNKGQCKDDICAKRTPIPTTTTTNKPTKTPCPTTTTNKPTTTTSYTPKPTTTTTSYTPKPTTTTTKKPTKTPCPTTTTNKPTTTTNYTPKPTTTTTSYTPKPTTTTTTNKPTTTTRYTPKPTTTTTKTPCPTTTTTTKKPTTTRYTPKPTTTNKPTKTPCPTTTKKPTKKPSGSKSSSSSSSSSGPKSGSKSGSKPGPKSKSKSKSGPKSKSKSKSSKPKKY